jgi:hypothetical protein
MWAARKDNMERKNDYRKANGRRVEGHSLAIRIAQEVLGLMLAHAYVMTKSAGFQLNINKLDGVPRMAALNSDKEVVNVDVVDGFIKKSWAN